MASVTYTGNWKRTFAVEDGVAHVGAGLSQL
jgi:hypothetical protein